MSTIPIRNIYYLLSYAWDLLDEADTLAVEKENLPRVLDLLASLLVCGTRRLLRRGMDRGYIPNTEVLPIIRGRIDFGATSRRMLMEQGKVQCDFEEFFPDLLHNQVLKATLRSLSACCGVDSLLKANLHTVLQRMEGIGISPLRVRSSHFTQIRLHRNNAHYRFLMHLCELVHENLLINEKTGEMIFRDFAKDEKQMARLFEAFVASFYRKETNYAVAPQEHIHWDSPEANDLLPEMRVDAVIRGQGRTIVVECKYYQETLQSGYWSGKLKLRSSHLYQLSTYMQNLGSCSQNSEIEGLLIYPTVENISVKEDLCLSGKLIRVRTVDFDVDWKDVEAQMHAALRRFA